MNEMKSRQPEMSATGQMPVESPIQNMLPQVSDKPEQLKADTSDNDAVAAWKAQARKQYDDVKAFYNRYHRRPGIHAEILRRYGLPPNLNHAALALGISTWTLRKRLQRNPDSLLRPLRRYMGRQVNVPISPMNQTQDSHKLLDN